ncbi:MAG: cytochrome [Verrucomicrobiaceae bacterium]|nr:cytochrome [Verrucomicrobiaceae bacterium]
MKKIVLIGAILLGTSSHLAMAAGDAAAGRSKSAVCAACHGSDGNSAAPTFPKLAGQSERYLNKQLHDIKGKVRVVPAMAGIADNLSDQDIADLGAYFSSQKATVNQAKKDTIVKGEQIFRGGIRDKSVPACTACHSPDGSGNALAGFPHLGGQHSDYVSTQLKAYRAAADGDATGRANDGDTKPMRTIASRLSDSEIAALANYISGLH